jgi:4-amino-4-deoxy-L-arabinose transferase-like glycosyltransferase
MTRHTAKSPYQLLVIILLLMWAVLTVRINAGWYGHHDENGRWISTAVRNYNLYGAENLAYLVTTNSSPATPETAEYYVNHPPLIVWTAWLSSTLFGRYQSGMPYPDAWPTEMAVRLVSIFATMINLSAFYVLCRRLLGTRLAILCLCLYSFTPMIAYYGRMPNHEPLVLPFICLFAAIFVNWMRRFTLAQTVVMALCAVIAMWTAWAAAFFFGTLGIVALIYGQKQQRWTIIGIGIITIAATILVPVFYELQRPGSIDTLLKAFTFRTSTRNLDRASEDFTLTQYLLQLISHMFVTMSFGVTILGAWGIVLSIRNKTGLTRAVILALLLACVGYMLVFRNAFHVHDYYKIFYMLSFAIGAAIAVNHLWLLPRHRMGRYARPFVVGILLYSLIAGVYWFNVLHRTSMKPILHEIVASLPTYTQESDIILTNLSGIFPMIDYYTYRTLVYDITPQEAINRAEAGNEHIKYLFCVLSDGDGTIFDDVFGESSVTVVTDDCRLVELN